MPDNLYCEQTTPWQGVFFLRILFKGKLIHYIILCVIPILLCCYHTFHLGLKFEFKHSLHVAYQNLTFKSVKQNYCFRNRRWDAVKSRQALKKGCIKSTNQNAIFLPEYIKLQSELVQTSTCFWLVYLQTSRHATQMNWINTKVKCIVHMGLSKVKILRRPVVS